MLILWKDSAATPGFFNNKRQNAVPITLKKEATAGNAGKFHNSPRKFHIFLVVDALNAFKFKVDAKTTWRFRKCSLKKVDSILLRGVWNTNMGHQRSKYKQNLIEAIWQNYFMTITV